MAFTAGGGGRLHSKVNTCADLLDDAHFQAISAVAWIYQTGVGRIPLAAIPVMLHADEATCGQAPAIGEHSREVLSTLGLPFTEIERLLAAVVVADASEPALAEQRPASACNAIPTL